MTPRTHCPTCGAKIARADLSICSYCLTPLALGGERKPRDSATAQRLAKMRDHPEFKAAVAWDPPEGPEYRRAAGRQSFGLALLVAGALCAAYSAFVADGAELTRVLTRAPAISAGLFGLAGVGLWIAGARAKARIVALPLLKRPALVTARRSETRIEDGGATIYSFMLEFDDGSEGEFRFRGLGASHDPLVAGNLGLAYTRRETLLAFRLIRV